MKCITIQHKDVLKKLTETGIYTASRQNVSENLIKPYLFMQKQLGFDNIPIFLAPEGYKVELTGAKFTPDHIAIELDIPKEYIYAQRYYDWSDFIYFLETPDEFHDCFNDNRYFIESSSDDNGSFSNSEDDVKAWGKTILNVKLLKSSKDVYQVVTPELRKEWILNTLDDLSMIEELHDGSGGSHKMKTLYEYQTKK